MQKRWHNQKRPSISTISEFLCFSSQSHFHTAFKKQFGITPSEYRKQQND
ncbi:MAG: helix-turn-helix transcriptional regulator [Clostridiales bacterium]|nr:helix-turn-helix transcriptional regulator [Clostridiales bacterium]